MGGGDLNTITHENVHTHLRTKEGKWGLSQIELERWCEFEIIEAEAHTGTIRGG